MGKKHEQTKHKIIILTGKSSSGKDAIMRKLVVGGYHPIVTYTTRPPREKEVNGVDYNFVSYNDFQDMIVNGNVIEHRIYHTVFGDWYYGSSDLNIDLDKHDYVIILTLDGAQAFINRFGVENCIVFYIDCPKSIREERARKRGSFNEDEWQRRLLTDKNDFSEEKIIKTCNFKIANYDKPLYNVVKEILNDIKLWKTS
jgi:guanylate kinase